MAGGGCFASPLRERGDCWEDLKGIRLEIWDSHEEGERTGMVKVRLYEVGTFCSNFWVWDVD